MGCRSRIARSRFALVVSVARAALDDADPNPTFSFRTADCQLSTKARTLASSGGCVRNHSLAGSFTCSPPLGFSVPDPIAGVRPCRGSRASFGSPDASQSAALQVRIGDDRLGLGRSPLYGSP